jgi:hypothetical protein
MKAVFKNRSYWTALAITLGLLGLVVLYVLEFPYFDRTLNVRSLIGWSVAIGVLLGAWLGYRFRHQAGDLTEGIQLYVFFIVMSALFMPLFGSLSNRMLTWRKAVPVPVEFIDQEARYASRFGLIKEVEVKLNQYFIFFYKDQELYRIKSDVPLFSGKVQGDTVRLPMKRGLWGYEVVLPGKKLDLPDEDYE